MKLSKPATFIRELCDTVSSLPYLPNKIHHVSVLADSHEPIDFLSCNSGFQQLLWQGRDNEITLAGLGVAEEFSTATAEQAIREVRASSANIVSNSGKEYQPLFFGGFAFDESSDDGVWEGFPASYFVLPQICFSEHHGEYFLHVHIQCDDERRWPQLKEDLICQLQSLRWILPEYECDNISESRISEPQISEPSREQTNIDSAQWQKLCDEALKTIDRGDLKKVVLARELLVTSDKKYNVYQLLKSWNKVNPDTYCFMLQRGEKYLIGCSPERLYQRFDQQIKTESLAGTVRRGTDISSDKRLSQKLLDEPRLVNEHGLVTEFITQQLEPVCHSVDLEPNQVLQLEKVQHRYQKIEAKLKDDVTDAELISLLHPTPAVCGYPQNSAKAYLAENEPLARGWYSGGIGVLGYGESKQFADFAVAIRSALLDKNQLHCFSGVGLIKGSDAEEEWQELDAKIDSLLDVIYGKKLS